MQTSPAGGDEIAVADLAFLYRRKREPDAPYALHERSFFLDRGSDVPPKYPNKKPLPTLWDLVVVRLRKRQLSALALAGRAPCDAVRKRRFRILRLHPHMNHTRLVRILRPDTVLPYIRQLTVNGRLRHPGMISPEGQADHRWLNKPSLVQLIADINAYSPIEFLFLQSLSWGDIRVEVRTSLRSIRTVRALMVHDVDFWNSNQYLMTLNAYPALQFLNVWHANFHACTHVPAQLQRTEPLLLTELIAGCTYTGLLMEWLLGRRKMLAVEELTLDSKDLYRHDVKLARVLKTISPWLKRLFYMEYTEASICEGVVYGPSYGRNDPPKPWTPPQITEDELLYDEEDAEVMDLDYDDPPDVMDEDSESESNAIIDTHTHAATTTSSMQSPLPHDFNVTAPNLLPDDEDRNRFEDCESDLVRPPFSSTEERGYRAFMDELVRRIDTPMLEAIDARIDWTSAFSLLTLKMLCQLTYTHKGFYRFEVWIVFATPELFESAPWTVIDTLLWRASRRLPGGVDRASEHVNEEGEEEEEEEPEGLSLRLLISVRGWGVQEREGRARMRDLRRNLPRTSAENLLEIELEEWYPKGPLWAPNSMLE